jgi:hypothetical protein
MALERDMKFFMIQPIANEDQAEALELMKHPRSVVTFSDSGAHVSQIMDSSLQTHLLSHWVREKQAFTLEEAVKMITCDSATQFGFHDRGLLREGMAADIVVFDPATVGPRMPEVVTDLPAGPSGCARRPTSMRATIVNGQVLLRDNEPTGNLPAGCCAGGRRAWAEAPALVSSLRWRRRHHNAPSRRFASWADQGFSRSRDAPLTALHPETIPKKQEPSQPRAGMGQSRLHMRARRGTAARRISISE